MINKNIYKWLLTRNFYSLLLLHKEVKKTLAPPILYLLFSYTSVMIFLDGFYNLTFTLDVCVSACVWVILCVRVLFWGKDGIFVRVAVYVTSILCYFALSHYISDIVLKLILYRIIAYHIISYNVLCYNKRYFKST
jgi:hypothetical protein